MKSRRSRRGYKTEWNERPAQVRAQAEIDRVARILDELNREQSNKERISR